VSDSEAGLLISLTGERHGGRAVFLSLQQPNYNATRRADALPERRTATVIIRTTAPHLSGLGEIAPSYQLS
jgi:hypothetical protein